MGKNVAVFVDVANIFYAAKAAGVDIDYVTLLKAAIAGRDFVRAYAYTGLDPDNENQRNFHSFLSRHGYKVVSKDIRKYGDGKVKANLDIELVVDMMKTARNLDVAIVISGDGDFAPAIRAVQEMGVRVEVISFRGNTSSDLIEVADIFTDIVALAKVERGSSRSGRRVAEEEFDMTNTDVPDKQTEGTGTRQRRGRGRGRGYDEAPSRGREPVAREPISREPISREPVGREPVYREPVYREPAAAAPAAGGPLTVLPGEKLSRVARPAQPIVPPDDELDDLIEDEEFIEVIAAEGALPDADGESGEPRRRRRRGGRGRGRGRGRPEDGLEAGGEPGTQPEEDDAPEPDEEAQPVVRAGRIERPERIERPARPERPVRDLDEDVPLAPRGPKPTPFGSFWDSQLGMPTAPAAGLGPLSVEDEEEPEIPEYLLAERRRGVQGQGQGNRGGQGVRGGRGMRPGYSAALDRERYGRGGGGLNRYGEPNRPQTQDSQQPPQVQSRPQGPRREDRPQGPRRDDRPQQPLIRQERPQRAEEPWSEVPPEIEQMLRAQMAARPQRPAQRPQGGAQSAADGARSAVESPAAPTGSAAEETAAAPARRRGRPPRAEATAPAAVETASAPEAASTAAEQVTETRTPARRGRPPRAAAASAEASTSGVASGEASAPASAEPETASTAPARRGRRPASAGTAAPAPAPEAAPAGPAPASSEEGPAKPRRGRPPKAASVAASPSAEPAASASDEGSSAAAAPARARRGRPAASSGTAGGERASETGASDTESAAPAGRRRTARDTTSSE